MPATFKARILHGLIEPLEKVDLPEGEELMVTINRDDWSELAEQGFARDWDNDSDAVYDNWKELYHV